MSTNPADSRSVIRPNHALITPASHVWSPLPGWQASQGATLIAPAMGAGFVQTIVQMERDALAGPAAIGCSRFVYLLEGAMSLGTEKLGKVTLDVGGFAYIPPSVETTLRAESGSRLLLFEKPYVTLTGAPTPDLVVGNEQKVEALPFLGDPDALLKNLLPALPAFDFEINLFQFAPGASLPLVEVHVMEHGLLLLGGQGIYRLDDQWYPVQAGDVIWMGPFCPQWFVAIGKQPARYLYYKNVNRNPLETETA